MRERFMQKVEITDSCWLWRAYIAPNGYGRFGVSVARGPVEAHRVAYELFVGEIPEGLEIDHLCRVRHCVNPEHLEAVTRRVNTLRGISPAAVNAAKTECVNGHAFSAENTRINADGGRACRACHRERQRIYSRKAVAA